MPDAVVDSNVVVGARLRRDRWHGPGTEIVGGMDTGVLPRGRVIPYGLAELLTAVENRAGDGPAVATFSGHSLGTKTVGCASTTSPGSPSSSAPSSLAQEE